MEGESEIFSDTATNCNLPCLSETMSDITHAKQDTLDKKALHLRLVLEKDFKAADLKWSLFVAAAFSFRYESCLRPFPSGFLKNGTKDMDELLSVISDVPALDLVLKQLDNPEKIFCISDIIDLLFYVLVRQKEPTLKSVPPELHNTVLANVNMAIPAAKPQHIFQVISSNKSAAENRWKELAKNHKVFYAYHGNRLENFYTLINFGLQQHLNKNIVGPGVHLSSELSVSVPLSHGGFGWGASCVGGHLSCVAMCEVIDAPEGINYHKPVNDEGDNACDETKSTGTNQYMGDHCSEGQISHYLVTNSDLIRIRYLLVYAKQPSSLRFATTNTHLNNGSIRCWFNRHKLFSILLGYGLMLATIGFANNQPIHYYYKIFLKKLDLAYNLKAS